MAEDFILDSLSEMYPYDREERCRKTIRTLVKAIIMRIAAGVLLAVAVIRANAVPIALGLTCFALLLILTGMLPLVRELKKPDVVVLAEIYAARERTTVGISSADLAKKVPGSVFCETLPEVTEFLRRVVQPGDIVLTMGAGDIFRAGEALLGK